MQWCNLFSSASKYNISVRPSRYKRVVYGSLPLGACLVTLISLSYAYLLALVILIACLFYISIYISRDNNEAFIHYLTITTDGLLTINNDKAGYQLLTTSRLGFIGCWLVLQKRSVLINPSEKTNQAASRQLFIFRDSLSEQDYARLVSVLKQIR